MEHAVWFLYETQALNLEELAGAGRLFKWRVHEEIIKYWKLD